MSILLLLGRAVLKKLFETLEVLPSGAGNLNELKYPEDFDHIDPECVDTPVFFGGKKNNPNTPGTAGGPAGRDRTLAVKSLKNQKKINFFS